ncbi:hypothetical protein LAZ67_15000295, partial [Cordylochernes scorpioides]
MALSLCIRKRAPVRSQVTRISKEIISNLRIESKDYFKATVGVRRILDVQKVLLSSDKEIIDILAEDDEADLEKEMDDCAHYQEIIIEAIVAYEDAQKQVAREVVVQDSLPDTTEKIRLPTIELPKFSGNLIDWLTFWAQFEKIHLDIRLKDSDKFYYLLQSLSVDTEAYKIVSIYPLTEENYSKAIDALRRRYANPDLLLQVYVRELLKLVIDSASGKKRLSFHELYYRIQSYLGSLKSLNLERASPDTWLYPLVESCLSDELLLAWQRRSQFVKLDVEHQTRLDQLMDFLEREILIQQNIQLAKGGFQSPETSDQERRKGFYKKKNNIPTVTGLQQMELGGCIFCEKKHASQNCFAAKKMSLEEKRKVIREKKVCFKCLKGRHLARYCRTRVRCYNCGSSHFLIMCTRGDRNNKEAAQLGIEPELTSQNSERVKQRFSHRKNSESFDATVKPNEDLKRHNDCSNQVCQRNVALQTLMLNIIAPKGRKLVRAFLDSGSQHTYILKTTAEELGLKPVTKETVHHALFGGIQTTAVTHNLYDVQLKADDENFVCKVTVRDQSKICQALPRIPKTSLISRELEQRKIKVTDLGNDNPPIELLIGSLKEWSEEENSMLVMSMKNEIEGVEKEDSETAVDSYVGVKEAESKDYKAKDSEPKSDGVKDSETAIKGYESVNNSEEKIKANKVEDSEVADQVRYFETIEAKDKNEQIEINSRNIAKTSSDLQRNKRPLKPYKVYRAKSKRSKIINLCFHELLALVLLLLAVTALLIAMIKDEIDGRSWSLHLFTDASRTAYSAVVFHRVENEEIRVSFMSAKTRVTPMKGEILKKNKKTGESEMIVKEISIDWRTLQESDCVRPIKWRFNPPFAAWWGGPKLQNNIFNILLKFRTNSVALVSYIEKMYRQIRLHPDDIKYQTILWRDCKDLELQEYNLLTVTYGLACAPYLAIRTLHQIAHEVQVSNPKISKIIREDFYMDDLLTGCPTVEDAKGLMQQLIAVLGSGGFVLRKWVSNETSIIEDLPSLLRGKGEVMEFNRKESNVNVLGIQWDPSYDTLNISCKSGPADIKSKRQIVSAISRIYDPCGWLSPTTVVLKLLLQELWKLKIGWDEDIPASIQRKWNTFEREMKHFQQISIPRCIFQRNLLISNMQMHGFCDSSELAYSAVCYLRITYENNQIETILLTAKTKVAPIKKITIPRLELCAALMLAQLQSQTTQALPFKIDEQFYWTDSKIVLAWITSESKKWQIFVANRVAKIQDLTAAHSWQYISGKQNPADLATRGILPSCLINSKLWCHGPVWLTLDGSENIPSFTIDPSMGLEERSVILHATIAEPCPEFFSKYSSFTKLLRVIAWCKRLIYITRKQPTQRLSFLTSQDLKDSLLQIVKIIQRCEFTPEINACIKNIPLPRKSRLISLNIFIDSQGILRVGGRLRHSDLDIDQKHPMLIPKDHFVTKLIVMHYHINNLHSGTQLTLSLIRNKFWIPSGRNLIKRVLNQCLVCLKSKSKAIHQIMGDLPKNRLLPGRPFEKIGIDLAGPIQAKPMLKRSKVIFKFYIVLFVCFTTKAIHLEISSDLTAETFLAALKRFISRRGRPTDIYSDNATNFKGASNILKERWKLFNAANIQHFSAIESINWHFIPPSAPNFGGLWEAGIKSVKTILSKTMKSRLLNYEELLTLLAQIEACLNSRPLTFVSNDPNDLTALTPGHFLIGNAIRHDAESDHSALNLRSRWDLIQPQKDYFWNRWSCEYLHQLQERRKWRTSHPDVNIGDLVMLKEQNKPLQWKLARIVQIFPGEDDHVRVVLLRTPKGLLKRPITKLCPLPYK